MLIMENSSVHSSSIFSSLPPSAREDLKAHWLSYLIINGILLIINLAVGYSYPWHLFPLLSWGIGIAIHTLVLYVQLHFKQYYERGFYIHFGVFLIVSAYFCLINLITGFSYPWFLWPVAVWGIGMGEHFVAFKQIQAKTAKIPLHPLYNMWYSAIVCFFLAFVNFFTGTWFLWFWIPCLPIMLLSYYTVSNGGRRGYQYNQLRRNEVRYRPHRAETRSSPRSPQVKKTDRKFCPACGEKTQGPHRFCENCGQKLW
jgi:hypothetical protein